MGLDIHSDRGRKSLADEARCVSIIESAYPDWEFLHTPKSLPAAVDGILVCDGIIRAVVEQKSRYDLSLDKFRGAFNSEWLVTYDKLRRAAEIAEGLCVPLVGFLYLVDERIVLSQRLWTPDAGFIQSMRRDRTQTRAKINGGTAVRDNAFIDMRNARIIYGAG